MATIEQFAALNALIVRALPSVITRLPNIEETLRLAGKDREKLADGLLHVLLSFTGETKQALPEVASPPPAPEPLPDVIELSLGGRIYRAPRIIADGEVVGEPVMLARAKERRATSGREDCKWFLSHQDEINAQIPIKRRGEFIFVFTEWHLPVGSGRVALVCWDSARWVQDYGRRGSGWSSHSRPVERRT